MLSQQKILKSLSVLLLVFTIFSLCIISDVKAEILQPNSSVIYALAAWEGATDSNNNKRVLQGHGTQVVMTVGTYNANNSDWYCVSAPDGDFYLQNRVSPYELVNITRILQNNSYYNCRGYWYDSSTNGRDQRLKQLSSYLYLANPLVSGGTWLLQPYSSSFTSSCDVIFYTGMGNEAKWDIFDNTY